ncbi:MAG: hypothetical protein ACKO81_04775 [Planctomycetota bacterium]
MPLEIKVSLRQLGEFGCSSDEKCAVVMLTVTDINDFEKKRAWILIPAMSVGLVTMSAYLSVIAFWQDSMVDYAKQNVGEGAAACLSLAMLIPSIGFFLAPLVWAERKSKHYLLLCPECKTDLSDSSRRVVATRCCGHCGKQIVEGRRIRSGKAFERLARIEQRRALFCFLYYWLWVWPILGLLILGYHWINPTASSNCPEVLFLPGFIGTTMTGWIFARTMDKRYLLLLGASAIVLCLGMNAFWCW